MSGFQICECHQLILSSLRFSVHDVLWNRDDDEENKGCYELSAIVDSFSSLLNIISAAQWFTRDKILMIDVAHETAPNILCFDTVETSVKSAVIKSDDEHVSDIDEEVIEHAVLIKEVY